MPSINQTTDSDNSEVEETNGFESNVHFFVMIPYIVGSDIGMVLDLFLKQLPPAAIHL